MKFKEFERFLNQQEIETKNNIIDKLYHYDTNYFKENFDIDTKLMHFLLSYYKLGKDFTWNWYTNGTDNLSLPNTATVPEGYHKGRTKAFATTTKDKYWITNGVENHLIAKDVIIPEGFYKGTCAKSTSNYIWVNNGVEQKLVAPDNIPEGFIYKGKVNTDNYIKAAEKRKKETFTNGVDEIRLTKYDTVPEGFYKGRRHKLSFAEKVKLRDEEYKAKGYIAVKNLTTEQLIGYVFYRDKTNELTDIIYKPDVYTYINVKYLPMFEEYSKVNHSKGVSAEEDLFYDYLKSVYKGEIIRHNRNVLVDQNRKFYEMDFYLPEKNIGIEFNGIYWHSELNKDKDYHFKKSKLAEEKGIRLINIYEDEWFDSDKQKKIKLMLNIALGNQINKIYARKCQIREISNKEASVLNNEIHIQGHRNAQVTYGLFHNDELVQLMSFSKTRFNRNLKGDNDWEIIRGCPGSNNLVIGGVSKLFKHFIKDYKPDSVFSYCDLNKFDGKSYEALGMKFVGYTGPDMFWIIDGVRVPRNPMKHNELKEKAQFRLFGSGSKKYLWETEHH